MRRRAARRSIRRFLVAERGMVARFSTDVSTGASCERVRIEHAGLIDNPALRTWIGQRTSQYRRAQQQDQTQQGPHTEKSKHHGPRVCRLALRSAEVSPHFSPGFVARGRRRPWIRGAGSSARGSVLEQYVEHVERAQRSRHGLIVPRSRKLVRNAG